MATAQVAKTTEGKSFFGQSYSNQESNRITNRDEGCKLELEQLKPLTFNCQMAINPLRFKRERYSSHFIVYVQYQLMRFFYEKTSNVVAMKPNNQNRDRQMVII